MAIVHANQIVNLLKETPGLSDPQITDALLGPGKPQQIVNQLCRSLERSGHIVRRKRADGIIGNFIADGSAPIQTTKATATRTSILPPDVSMKLHEVGRLWAESSSRRRLEPHIKRHWDELIDAWVGDPDLPLAVRKMGGVRGAVTIHQQSGREIVLADNSPAQWAFCCALRGDQLSPDKLRDLLKTDKIPFAFARKRSEQSQMKYTATLSSCGVDLNKNGWKLCHIKPVGLKTTTKVELLPIGQIENHFRLLMKPSNHFLVPKQWSGLGEIPEVIEEIRKYDA